MIRLALDEGVEAADAALPEAGSAVMASDDLQAGVKSLLEHGPGTRRSGAVERRVQLAKGPGPLAK